MDGDKPGCALPWAAVGKADADEYYDQRFAFQKQGFSVRSALLATNLRELVYISCYAEKSPFLSKASAAMGFTVSSAHR